VNWIRSYANSGQPRRSKWQRTASYPKIFPLPVNESIYTDLNFNGPVIWALWIEVINYETLKGWRVETHTLPQQLRKSCEQSFDNEVWSDRRLLRSSFAKSCTQWAWFSEVKTKQGQMWLPKPIRWKNVRRAGKTVGKTNRKRKGEVDISQITSGI